MALEVAPASAWVRAREKVERTILDQYLVDRDSGRPVQLAVGAEPVASAGLSYDELAEAAHDRALEICRVAIREHESPEAVMVRKLKRGEAA